MFLLVSCATRGTIRTVKAFCRSASQAEEVIRFVGMMRRHRMNRGFLPSIFLLDGNEDVLRKVLKRIKRTDEFLNAVAL